MNRPLTPTKAIRARCLRCMETLPDVKRCPFNGTGEELCALWPYRLGRNPKLAGRHNKGSFAPARVKIACPQSDTPKTTVQRQISAALCHRHGPRGAIRAHCLWCCLDQPSEVLACTDTECPLHKYRIMGKKEG